MKQVKPLIKFNHGEPIALCNRCFVIICNVVCANTDEDVDFDDEFCKVINIHTDSMGHPHIIAAVGDVPPCYCSKCKELLDFSLNE